MKKDYIIGLDIGTTSVGWAVVEKDTNNVMKKRNKALWGIRLFKEAEPASARRLHRSNRRRYQRRRERIKLLREFFSDEMNKVDSEFYAKLDESFFNSNDKVNKKHVITNEEKELMHHYKTIYHLRKDLMEVNKKFDIRLVYLAIHHIIKYRGNFNYNFKKLDIGNLDIKSRLYEAFDELLNLCSEIEFVDNDIESINYDKLEKAILTSNKNDRKILIKNELEPFISKNTLSEIIKLLIGNKFSVSKLFNIELEEDIKISFANSDYDDNYDKLEKALGVKVDVLESFKKLYTSIFLKSIFKNRDDSSLSNLMVYYYGEHENDLLSLKKILQFDRKKYREVFRSNSKYTCLYDKYIHNSISYDDFVKELNKIIDKVIDKLDKTTLEKYLPEVQERIKNGVFIPRITSVDNGQYPYQLNSSELVKIIENQGKYYPFLLEKINGDYKLVKLLSFKIPYYVGPLVDETKSDYAWMKRNPGFENVKITPYNFDEVVDKETSAEKFITRMLGKCTYLINEPAMPNNSILYSEYKVLNELKQIRVNGNKLTHEFQHRVINDFFKKTSGALTDEKFKKFLISSHEYDMYDKNLIVTGYSADSKFANTMQSYVDFFGSNGFFKDTELGVEDAENIINWITIFEDKDILENKISKEYPMLKSVLNRILKKKYTGWSNLSKKLLTTKYCFNGTKSIMDLMWETDENFMQIINNDQYKIQKFIAQENSFKTNDKLNYKMVDDLATSPANKRGIWQSLQIVEELVDYIGYEPSSISIEMARGKGKKGRRDNRKEYLNKIYKANKNSINDYKKINNELKSIEKIDTEKMFLYFIQEGKSLYSGVPLDINDLSNCEVDHIIPRTLLKDDSIDNKALVLREENQEKSANFVLPARFVINNKNWWEHLKKIGLISSKKFYNLMRKEYKTEDIEGFINRQLVETRQITKHVANIIQELHPKSKIVYLPASLSHNYREKFKLYKFRKLNDYHHAFDAYLAAVLAEYKNYFDVKVNYENLKKITQKILDERKYNELRYGYVINSIDSSFEHFNKKTGEIFDINKFIDTVDYNYYRNDILVSFKNEIKTGEFYHQNISKKGTKGANIKRGLDTNLYGSYINLNTSYAVVVRYTSRKKKVQKMIGIPICYADNELLKNDYIRKTLNLKDNDSFEIITKPIPMYSLLVWNNKICLLVGATNKVELWNAKELRINKKDMKKYKYMLNRLLNNDKKCIDDDNYIKELYSFINYLLEKIKKEYLIYEKISSKLDDMLRNRFDDEEEMIVCEKIIIQLLNMLSFSSDTANFKFLDSSYPDRMGRMNGQTIEHATIINNSLTGLRIQKNEF